MVRPYISSSTLLWSGGLLLTVVLWALLIHGNMDLLIAVVIAGALLVISMQDKASAAILTLAYLNVLGDVRRVVDVEFGRPVLDLLLLVGPGVAFCLALPVLIRVRLKDNLSKAVFALLALMILEIFNPQQGGLAVGFSGALFYIAPVLWFWVAQRYASPAVINRLLYSFLFPLAVVAAILGTIQTFVGFIPYEQEWIDIAGKTYHALYVGKSVRAFGFSVSGAEYATLLAVGAAGTAAAYFGKKRLWSSALLLLIPVLVLASSRSLVLKLIVAFAVIWTAKDQRRRGGTAVVKFAFAVLLGLVGIGVIASRFAPANSAPSSNASATQNLLAHQAGGLAHPLDKRYSTVGIHSGQIAKGILLGITDPLGHGLGSTTAAGSKFGGVDTSNDSDSVTGSSEMDFSDMFIGLGLVGGLIYIYVMATVMLRALRYVQEVELGISLPILSILTLTLGSWLIGGQYSTSSMLFFLIGSMTYQPKRGDASTVVVPMTSAPAYQL